jgi:phosphoenolpyruvate synthase/pyruvate phosphate dikinase
MLFLKSLSGVTQNELQASGYRAQDLAFLHQHQLPTPAAFVVLSTALDETVRLNNLKYKIDYIMSHAQLMIPSSLANVYSGARKALLEAKLPAGLETELRGMYEQITTPLAVGELTAERPPVRIIMSSNRPDDPESNDTIIQNINNFDELLLGVREAWALAWHPAQLASRMREHYPENRFKVALIVQSMEEPQASCHAYSSLPQDHKKVYLQVYLGQLDLREKVLKDYYAISKDSLRVVASQIRDQTHLLVRADKELVLQPSTHGKTDKLIDRDILEVSRLAKRAERLLQLPLKIFFSVRNESVELLWANRLGFDIIVGDESEQIVVPPQSAPEPAPRLEPAQAPVEAVPTAQALIDSADDFIAAEQPALTISAPPASGVAAKLLNASLRIVRQIVERKYRSAFSQTDPTMNIADMINKLNQANVFSRTVDGPLLLQAEEAARQESRISDTDYAKAIEEVAFLMSYA